MLSFWRDVQYIHEDLLRNLETNYFSTFMTSVQDEIFKTINSNNKIYNIVSPSCTGTTLALCLITILNAWNSPKELTALWIGSSEHSLLNTKKIFEQLNPLFVCATDPPDSLPDVYMFSLNKDIYKKRADTTLTHYNKKFKIIVLDGADEILEQKANREWLGLEMIKKIFVSQTTDQPTMYFSQHFNSSHVSTFIKELENVCKNKCQICLSPRTLICELNTFALVPQYYSPMLNDDNWLKKLLGNYKKPIRKGVLLFGQFQNFGSLGMIRWVDLDTNCGEIELYERIQRIKDSEVKIGICERKIGKTIQTLGIGCVIHVGLPMTDNRVDIAEYRARVERAYSPTFIGFSVIVCYPEHTAWVQSCANQLHVMIETLPLS